MDNGPKQTLYIFVISIVCFSFGLYLNISFFRDPYTEHIIDFYEQKGAPFVEEIVKIGLAGFLSIIFTSFSSGRFSFNLIHFYLLLLVIAGILGVSEVLDGKVAWNIIDHLAYTSLFVLIFYHYRSENIKRNVLTIVRAFLAAWLLHLVHNILVLMYKDTADETFLAVLFWIISPIIIYFTIIRVCFDVWPPWKFRWSLLSFNNRT